MSEVQVWVLSGVVSVALALFLILFRNWINNQRDSAKDIRDLRDVIIRQSEQLKTLFMIQNDIKTDVRNLEKRVGKLEQTAYKDGSN